MEDDKSATTVELFVYDLSKGMAAVMSQVLIGRHLDGLWHTAIVVYGREYFFGPRGIQSAKPGSTDLQKPLKVEEIGQTYLPYSVFWEYVNGLGISKFAPGTYNLFQHNCNTFTDEVSNFLVGKGIPKYIIDLPEEILSTPLGQSLSPIIDALSRSARADFSDEDRFYEERIQRQDSPEYELLNLAIEEARLNSIALEEKRNVINDKLAKKERKKRKKEKKKRDENLLTNTSCDSDGTELNNHEMADEESPVELSPTIRTNGKNEDFCDGDLSPSERCLQMEKQEKREQEEIKRQRDPPIIFSEGINLVEEFDLLKKLLEGKLTEEEKINIKEFHDYILENEGSWALGDNFLDFIGKIFVNQSLDSSVRVCLLKIISLAALKDDVILLLHQDRREHTIMNFAYDIDRHPAEEQLYLARFIANMFENLSSSEWLMYISEWQYQNQNISNIRVTTKVAVHSLLSDLPDLQIIGMAIIHNLACKEVKTVVFDDVAVELTMALLQYFNGSPAEEQLFVCMKSLSRFSQISSQNVSQLIQMIGPEPSKFLGSSQRIDELIEQINRNMRLH